MSDLTGLPDFQTQTSTQSASVFAPFGNGSHAVLPQQLVVAQDDDGNPKFLLELVERIGDFSAAGQYAVLDLALAGDFPLDEALTLARSTAADATVKPVNVNSGFARLYATSNEVVPTADMLTPIPLGWSGADYARWTMRLSMAGGELIRGALSSDAMLLGARIEFDVSGVAARIPASVEFDPSQLLASLLAGKTSRQMAVTDLLSIFSGPVGGFPLKVIGTASAGLAWAITDRIIAAYCSLTPSPGTADPAYVLFKDASQLETGTVHWDLSQPQLAYRQWVLMLDAIGSMRTAEAKNGIDSLVKNITIPPLQLGFCNIDFTANLPLHRSGLPAIGVNVQVAANPPLRPASINQTLTLSEPDDKGSVQFRLSPSETLAYNVTGFGVVVCGQTVQQYQTAPRPLSDQWVRLEAGDFPVVFAHVTGAPRLMALANLKIVLSYTINNAATQLQFVLTANAADIAVGIPRIASDASLAITATPGDGGFTLALPPMTPGRIEIDVTSFREYGPHIISIQCNFASGDSALFLDVLREEQATDSSAVPDKLLLTPDQPSTTWGYVASSPFRAGYCYRRSASSDAPAAPWSATLSPFAPLLLNADGMMLASGGTGGQPTGQQAASGT